MQDFRPCQGKNACRDDGQQCLVCGRTLEEIGKTQHLIQGLTDLVMEYGYTNTDEFAAYVARRIEKKVQHERERQGS